MKQKKCKKCGKLLKEEQIAYLKTKTYCSDCFEILKQRKKVNGKNNLMDYWYKKCKKQKIYGK